MKPIFFIILGIMAASCNGREQTTGTTTDSVKTPAITDTTQTGTAGMSGNDKHTTGTGTTADTTDRAASASNQVRNPGTP